MYFDMTKTKENQKYIKTYFNYVSLFLLLLATYPLSKTLFDAISLKQYGYVMGTETWLHSALLKKESKASAIPNDKKRILIVAGSNGLFGVSAKMIQSSTGIQTVNLSSHAALGGEYIFKKVQPLLRTGDVVLLPLEYPFYLSKGTRSDFDTSITLRKFLLSYDRKSLQKIPILSLAKFSLSNSFEFPIKEYVANTLNSVGNKSLSKKFEEERRKVSGGCYTSKTINEYGDETCNENKQFSPLHPAIFQTAMQPSNSSIDPNKYIKDFIDFSKSKSITIIPLFPVSTATSDYSQPQYIKQSQEIKKFWESQGVSFNDSLNDSILPPQLMYNSLYHPIDAGRQKRTNYIIKLIKDRLK
jgi:hypothetical protein